MKSTLLLFLLFTVTSLRAQLYYENYTWDAEPNIDKYTIVEDQDLITFKDVFITEFAFVEDMFVEYRLVHIVKWINSDEQIEKNNKIYLPINYNSELLVSKARVISPSNKVQTLDESMILTAKDDEEQQSYSFFALEGIEKGSYIEYYYVLKTNPAYKGKRITFQNENLKKNVSFKLIAPSHLVFAFNSYNGFPAMTRDTSNKEKNVWTADLASINKLKKEKESAYSANRQYVVYKLEKNEDKNTSNIISYNNSAKSFYKHLNPELSKKESSKLDKFIKKMKIDKKAGNENIVRQVEDYLKQKIYLANIGDDNLGDISYIIKNNTANHTGLMRLFIALTNKLNIKTEVVLTSNRFNTKFDPEFEATNFLDSYLLYFPQIDKYTSITAAESRLGLPPTKLINNHGLFIKELSVGSLKSGIGKVKFIPAPPSSISMDDMDLTVNFDPSDISNITIDLKRKLSGYKASFQNYCDLMNAEEKKDLSESIVKLINENIEIENLEISNDKGILYGDKPFELDATLKSDLFVDNVGNKYLFKIGELIGPQTELYSDSLRTQDVEMDYNKGYERIIKVNLPDGTKVKGLEDLNIHKFLEKDGEKILEFHSHYKLEDNILTVYADEYYKVVDVAVEDFEAYRSVINAAANFNKIVLLIE